MSEADTSVPPVPDAPVSIASPSSPLLWTVGVLSGALLVGVALTGWVEENASDRVWGRLGAPTADVVAPAAGRIEAMSVAEGGRVRPGDVLGVIVDDARASRIADVEQRIVELEAELARREARARVELVWRRKDVDAEILETELRTASLMQQQYDVDVNELAFEDVVSASGGPSVGDVWQPLVHEVVPAEHTGTRAAVQAERARNASEVYAVQLDLCEERLVTLRRTRDELAEVIARAEGVDAVEEELNTAVLRLSQLRERSDRNTLRAVGHGRVGTIECANGTAVAAGDVVCRVFDLEQPFVDAFVPSRRVAEFTLDGDVELDFGGVARTGRVQAIGRRAVVLKGQEDDPTAETFVRVRIEPTGKLWPEQPLGTRVTITSIPAS